MKRDRKIKIFSAFFSVCVIIIALLLFYQFPRLNSNQIKKESTQTANSIGIDKQKNSNLPQTSQKTNPTSQKPINILALGRPGQNYSGADLTDTIIILHLEPAQQKALMISLPRDLLVQVPDNTYLAKINSLYYRVGIEKLKQKIEQISGLKIDNYALIDLAAVENIIDLVDGLNVYVPKDIYDNFYPGPNHSYQTFNLSAGWRYLDGAAALKYIRTRYTSPNGDFDRMARQQQILYLLKQKVLSYNLLWDLPTYLKIYKSLKEHIQTDLSILELKKLWSIGKQINPNNVKTLVIDKKQTKLLRGDLINLGGNQASVIYPNAGQGNYQAIQEYIQEKINQ